MRPEVWVSVEEFLVVTTIVLTYVFVVALLGYTAVLCYIRYTRPCGCCEPKARSYEKKDENDPEGMNEAMYSKIQD